MVTKVAYTAFIGLVALERLVELIISKRNVRDAVEMGGREFGHEHYPFMVVLHSALLVGCVLEVWTLSRPFYPMLAFPMLVVAAAAQIVRYWVISTLGWRWSTRVVVVPGLPRIEHGPYRHFRHPNYIAVVAEGFALPLIHGAWVTAIVFSVLNAILLRKRIEIEDSALELSKPTVES